MNVENIMELFPTLAVEVMAKIDYDIIGNDSKLDSYYFQKH